LAASFATKQHFFISTIVPTALHFSQTRRRREVSTKPNPLLDWNGGHQDVKRLLLARMPCSLDVTSWRASSFWM
jgi:hypothetical protein